MTNREIMQQALDALKYHTEHTYPFHQTNVAMEALRQALAQPEQEPCKCIDQFWCATYDRCKKNDTI